MFMKDAAFWEQLQQELPRRNLTPKAMQRFEDTYRMLGVQKEAPVRKRRHKGLRVTATAACLCCGMLFGVNAAFPAFAESLPGWVNFLKPSMGISPLPGGTKHPWRQPDTYDPVRWTCPPWLRMARPNWNLPGIQRRKDASFTLDDSPCGAV